MNIELSDIESSILDILVCSVAYSGKSTTVRIAGGWVRDKLLGLSSDDIDVALDDCSGLEFAERVNAYMRHINEETHSVGVIEANPDRSKHLETATIKVKGVAIDCVNLRSESYTEDSRIPEIQYGTPLEDAMRRDFTLNSLFYNATSGEVEDYTGKGLDDLRSGVIRTPMEPMQTFIDDPLRVLRAIRFAARYDFVLDPPLIQAASSRSIREALLVKVSRERILKELDKMLGIAGYQESSSRPALALVMVHKLGLFRSIISLPDYPEYIRPAGTFTPQPPPTKKATKASETLHPSTIFRVVDADAVHTKGILNAWEVQSIDIASWINLVLVAMTPPLAFPSGVRVFKLRGEAVVSRTGHLDGSPVISLHYDPTERISTYPADSVSSCCLPIVHLRDGFTTIMRGAPNGMTLMNDLGLDSVSVGLLYFAAQVAPLAALETPDLKKPAHANCMKKLSQGVLRDVLKVSNEHSKRIDAILAVQSDIVTFCRNGCSRVQAVLVLRQCRSDWRAALLLALAGELSTMGGEGSLLSSFAMAPPVREGAAPVLVPDRVLTNKEFEAIRAYSVLADALAEMRIDDCWSMSPLVDGKTLQKELGLPKGPGVGKAMDKQLRWQIAHPSGTKEECLHFLRS